jgi:hypothetical protein
MNPDISKPMPNGLFRYLYNHFLVRCPDFCGSLISNEIMDMAAKIEVDDLEAQLANNSWLIAIARPDLNDAVQALWRSMTPLARGDYLAGFTEATYQQGNPTKAQILFIREQLSQSDSIELTAEAACQIGCILLAMGMRDPFIHLLQAKVHWEEAIDRASVQDTRRWKTLHQLSKRAIDVLLEAALILKCPDAVELILEHGANPNILIWQLERSSNALYSALSYAIKNNLSSAVNALLKYGANPRGSDLVPARSPLVQAFELCDQELIKRLLAAGASLDDGPRTFEAPGTYGYGIPIEWVEQELSDLLSLLPIEAKPLFHSPNAQGGHYYTLLECLWGNAEQLAIAEEIGLDLHLTTYEVALLIQRKQYTSFCTLIGRLGESVKNEALARVQQKWPDFS